MKSSKGLLENMSTLKIQYLLQKEGHHPLQDGVLEILSHHRPAKQNKTWILLMKQTRLIFWNMYYTVFSLDGFFWFIRAKIIHKIEIGNPT
jgi:hypothetical protein